MQYALGISSRPIQFVKDQRTSSLPKELFPSDNFPSGNFPKVRLGPLEAPHAARGAECCSYDGLGG